MDRLRLDIDLGTDSGAASRTGHLLSSAFQFVPGLTGQKIALASARSIWWTTAAARLLAA